MALMQVFELMQSEGVSPSAVTYGCLMHGCGLQGKIDQAVGLYEEACSCGVFPSDECHNTLVNMFAKNNRLGFFGVSRRSSLNVPDLLTEQLQLMTPSIARQD